MNPTYEDEARIIWLKDHDALARMIYVRERWLLCSLRTGPVKAPPDEILIGYAVLKKTAIRAEDAGFYRRIFILHAEEGVCDPKGVCRDSLPPDAVDPLLVEAGKTSPRLDRAGYGHKT